LDAGHFIATDDVHAQGMQQRRIGVERTDGFDLLSKCLWLLRFGLSVEPVAAAVRLEIGLSLKSGR
jgi:hypothetical protein